MNDYQFLATLVGVMLTIISALNLFILTMILSRVTRLENFVMGPNIKEFARSS